ncbi:anthranilate synthase component I [Brevundimonas lutea]|uniref:anthranilate synthase component I n=1 Tax=Brevundimonas lutea TaxID=2293980 RepID=UPI000F0260F6|nr:anthranilate synthase component I [Brevundimonas lutea]
MTDGAFSAFADAWDAGHAQAVSRRLVDDIETPVSAYLKVRQARGGTAPHAFLLESVEGGERNGRYSILTLEPDLVWRARGDRAEIARGSEAVADGRFDAQDAPTLASLRALIAESRMQLPDDLPPMAAGLFGVFGYDMVRLLEPLGPANPDPLDLPDAVLTRPSIVAVFDSVRHEIVVVTPARPDGRPAAEAWAEAQGRLDAFESILRQPLVRPEPQVASAGADFISPVDETGFATLVARAKDYIAAGDIFQVVLSHRFSANHDGDPFAFYRALRRQNPSPYLFFLDLGDFQLAGSSPEILVRLKDGRVTIRPLAGTRRRGADAAEDAELEAELLADPKERAEHLMLLDLGRNDVGRVSAPGTVEVTESFAVERYSQVMHIVSNVTGQADPKLDAVDALLAALPAGTLSGAPKVRAMEIIDELETVKRGVGYGGGVGYISASGEADICIVLRTALFTPGQAHIQAGAGVVVDSDPLAEYLETRAKAGAPMAAAREAWRFG